MEEEIQKAQNVQDSTAISSITSSIESKIFTIRGKQVMIDRDLAVLYEVSTGNLNKAVLRNQKRFPADFMFTLTDEEWKSLDNLLFQNGIPKHGGSRYAPHAFTEHGIVVLANILKSDIAIDMSIKITRAFVAMRHYMINNAGILQRIDNIERKQIETDAQVDAILDRMQALEPKKQSEQLFQNGCVFDAWSYVSKLIREAKQEIILIDNYVDETVLAIMAKRSDNVKATIHTRYYEKVKTDIDKFNKQYPDKAVTYVQLPQHNHDRFLIIDEDVYHLGASLKDLGNTWGAMIKMNETKKADIISNIIRATS